MNRIRSLISTDYVEKRSAYDVVREIEDGNIYVWVGCGEEYLLYSDEYIEIQDSYERI